MENKKFSKKKALKFGWETLKENLGFFLIVGAILLIISIVPGIAKEIYKKTDSGSTKIIVNTISLLFQIVAMLLELGLIKITLDLFNKKKVKVADLFSQYPIFFKYLVGSIIYTVIIVIGSILFIVPGIIWGIKFRFFPYFIVEGSGIVESFKKSAQITQGSKWDLFIFGLITVLVALVGVLALFIGILITTPIIMMASVFVYMKLKKEARVLGPVK
jgi:uncharacterized membrane protein